MKAILDLVIVASVIFLTMLAIWCIRIGSQARRMSRAMERHNKQRHAYRRTELDDVLADAMMTGHDRWVADYKRRHPIPGQDD